MSNMEKFKYEQFSLTPEKHKKAEKEGRLEELEEKMKKSHQLFKRKASEKIGGITRRGVKNV